MASQVRSIAVAAACAGTGGSGRPMSSRRQAQMQAGPAPVHDHTGQGGRKLHEQGVTLQT